MSQSLRLELTVAWLDFMFSMLIEAILMVMGVSCSNCYLTCPGCMPGVGGTPEADAVCGCVAPEADADFGWVAPEVGTAGDAD
jgi:hypothetical protein